MTAKQGARLKLFLAAYTPEKTDHNIARQIGAHPAYVRATARRQGLLLAPRASRTERLRDALEECDARINMARAILDGPVCEADHD